MARKGDLIVVNAQRVGGPPREGEIIEVIEGELRVQYRVRWSDGHESLFAPGAGASRIEPARDGEKLERAAGLHDIGKIGIPDHILLAPRKLTPEEFEVVKTHTRIGAEILSGSRSPLLQMAEKIAWSHHERWDGTGYAGLAGEDIPVVGRITAVADVFDALSHDRPYKEAWSIERAINEISSQRGLQFDPQVVGAFLSVHEGNLDLAVRSTA